MQPWTETLPKCSLSGSVHTRKVRIYICVHAKILFQIRRKSRRVQSELFCPSSGVFDHQILQIKGQKVFLTAMADPGPVFWGEWGGANIPSYPHHKRNKTYLHDLQILRRQICCAWVEFGGGSATEQGETYMQ